MVLSTAVPTEPPTCCMVLTSAEATPASCGCTPAVAVFIDGAMTMPIAKPMKISDGSTPPT